MTALFERAARSGVWMTVAHGVAALVLVVRSVTLARLLPVETFGTYALAASIVALAAVVARWGTDSAFLHRAPETLDSGRAAPVHFTVQLTLSACVFGVLAAVALGFAGGALLTALLALMAAHFALNLTHTPQVLLFRRVAHRRNALFLVVRALASTAASLSLAEAGATLWALLAVDFAAALSGIAVFYVWRPVWRPGLSWHAGTVRYFLRFGWQSLLSQLLNQAWRRGDKLLTGLLVGSAELGLYARASAYAVEPSALGYRPMTQIVAGTLAALKEDRAVLSSAVENIAAILFRAACLLSGMAALAAPELVGLLIGEKWLPMVGPFRLLALAFAFEPLFNVLNHCAIALGRPDAVTRASFARLAVLIAAIAGLAPIGGIDGVAVAVAGSLLTGLWLLYQFARVEIDLSVPAVIVAPVVCVAAGYGAGALAATLMPAGAALFAVAAVKIAVYAAIFATCLAALELRKIIRLLRWADGVRRAGRPPPEDGPEPRHPDSRAE